MSRDAKSRVLLGRVTNQFWTVITLFGRVLTGNGVTTYQVTDGPEPNTIAFMLWLGVSAGMLFLSAGFTANLATQSYVGPEACAGCHKDIADRQGKTAMARTWTDSGTPLLPGNLDQSVSAGAGEPAYELRKTGERIVYSVTPPNRSTQRFPVDIVVGGERHGFGFLFRLESLDGLPLARAPLIQARYFWSPTRGSLLLAPGLQTHAGSSYETAIGLVLSPEFEARCVTCHGRPHTLGAGKSGGVRCETCHGPGSQHLQAIAKGAAAASIVNPAKLTTEESMAVCGRCHTGFGRFIDPSPDDLLVANQVTALRKSECFIQSKKGFTCVSCHDPHQDAKTDIEATQHVCAGCHSITQKPHAAICPVAASSNCVSCHMPSSDVGPLRLVDHWIRVHPEQGVKGQHADQPTMRTQIRPAWEYLRLISVDERTVARQAETELEQGASFYDVARRYSKDASSVLGGFLGDKAIAELQPKLAEIAAGLSYGRRSGIEQAGQRWVILERLPRDFEWRAERLLVDAEELRAQGDLQAAMQKAHESLVVYPQFVRALRFVATMLADAGAIDKGAGVLRVVTRLYPEDARSWADLGLMLGALGNSDGELDSYRRAISLEPDFVAAYLNLGKALLDKGNANEAAKEFRSGLQINPLSAQLYAGLAKALARTGDEPGSAQASKLAAAIDPTVIKTEGPLR